MTNEQRDRMLDQLLENQAHHDGFFQKLEELQMKDHVAISRPNNQMAAFTEQQQSFAEQHNAALLEIDNRLIRLEALIESLIRGPRQNGGRKKKS